MEQMVEESGAGTAGAASKPKNTRWTVLSAVTLALFAVLFVICAFFGECGGSLNTLTCMGSSAAGECSMGGCSGGCAMAGMSGADISAGIADGTLDMKEGIASGTCTIGSTPMKCHWSYLAAAVAALFGVLAALGMFSLPGVHGRRFAGILAIAAAFATAAFPCVLIGTCSGDMSCANLCMPVAVLCALAALCGVLAWFWCKPKRPSRGL